VLGTRATVAIFAYYIGVFVLALICDLRLPEPKKLTDAYPDPDEPVFIEQRARMMLKEMTNYGPRPTGSYENEVLTVEFLKYRIKMINQTVDRRFHDLSMDVQVGIRAT
jgi:hypothetical protein